MVDSVGSGSIVINPGVSSEPALSPEVAPSQEVSSGFSADNTVSVSETAPEASPSVEVALDNPEASPAPQQDLLQKAFEAKLDGFRAAVHEFNRLFNAQDIDINDGQSLILLIKGMLSDTQALISAESIDQVFGSRLYEQLKRESGADEARVLKGDINDRTLDIGEKNQSVQEHSETLTEKSSSKDLSEQQLATAQDQSELQQDILQLGQDIDGINNTLTQQADDISQSRELLQAKQQELAELRTSVTPEDDAVVGELDPFGLDLPETESPEANSDEIDPDGEGDSGGDGAESDSPGGDSSEGGAGSDNSEQVAELEEEVRQLESDITRQHEQLLDSTSLLAQKEGLRLEKKQQLAGIHLAYTASGDNVAELEPLQQGIARLQTDIEDVSNILTTKTQELSQKQEQRVHKQQELVSALTSSDNAEQVASLQQEIVQLDADIVSVQGEIDSYSSQLSQKQAEKLQISAEYSEVVIRQLQGNISQLQTDISGLESEVATLQQQIQQLESENAADSLTLTSVQRVLDSVTEEFVSLNNLLGKVKQRFDPVALETGEEGIQEVQELEQQLRTEVAREQLKLNDMKETLDTQFEGVLDAEIDVQAEILDDEFIGIEAVSSTAVGEPAEVLPGTDGVLSDIELEDLAAVFIPRDTAFLEQLIAALEKEESRRDDELPVPEEGFAIVLQSFGQSNNPALREDEVDPASGPLLGDSLSLEGADNPQVFARLMLEGRIDEAGESAATQDALLEEGKTRSRKDRQTVAEALLELQSVPDELAEIQRERDEIVKDLYQGRFG